MRTIIIAGCLALVALAGCSITSSPAAAATDTMPVTHGQNDRVPGGARWTQHYFPTADGVELHADVLLPERLPEGAKAPLVLSVGAYFGHSGQLSMEGFAHTGPSARFSYLVGEGRLLERGYGLVMVHSRGFGGSTGCTQAIGGPADQADVRAALDWAAVQPWSTGSVAMYGKSLDGVTALVGNNLNHPALKAVVAQEPIWTSSATCARVVCPVRRRTPCPPSTTRSPPSRRWPTTTAVTWPMPAGTAPPVPTPSARSSTRRPTWTRTRPPRPGRSATSPNERRARRLRCCSRRASWSGTPTPRYAGVPRPPRRAGAGVARPVGPQARRRAHRGRAAGSRPGGMVRRGVLLLRPVPQGRPLDGAIPRHRRRGQHGLLARRGALATGRPHHDRAARRRHLRRRRGHLRVRQTFPARCASHPADRHPARRADHPGHRQRDGAAARRRPDGTAVMINQQVSALRPNVTELQLKSMDWALPAGHSLAVEVGTIQAGIPSTNDWLLTVSGQEVTVRGTQLDLALDDPAKDSAIPGTPAPWMHLYRLSQTSKPTATPPSFTLS